MHITDVKTYQVGTPAPHKGGANWFFLRIETDEGLHGWGECTKVLDRMDTMAALVDELAESQLLGSDPFEVEALRKRLYRGTHDFHVPGSLQSQVIAAVEIACWDIIGKAVGKPVHKLLGGRINNQIRTYTYIHYKWTPPDPPSDAAGAARYYVDRGFDAIKLDPLHPIWGPQNFSLEELRYGADVIGAIREEVGSGCDILVGTHGQFDTQTAKRFGRMIEAYDPLWFEEPVPPEHPGEMAAVARSTDVPVATGERLTSIHQFQDLLQRDAVGIVQPDVGLLGLLGAKKVAGMAEGQYTPVAPWHYAGPIQGAANVQLAATLPNLLVLESIEDWGGFHNELLEAPIEWEDGSIVPPDRPGLGVDLDPAVLEDHPPNELEPPYDRPLYEMSVDRRSP